jgi:hypothetical protein
MLKNKYGICHVDFWGSPRVDGRRSPEIWNLYQIIGVEPKSRETGNDLIMCGIHFPEAIFVCSESCVTIVPDSEVNQARNSPRKWIERNMSENDKATANRFVFNANILR